MVALAMKWESVASAVPVLQNFLGCSVVTEIYAPSYICSEWVGIAMLFLLFTQS